MKVKRFGAGLISIIEKYCAEKQLPVNLMAAPEPPKPPKADTKFLSLELYRAGKTVDEIAAERGLVRTTIEGHLSHFVGAGEVDIYGLMDRKKVDEIEQFFLKKKTVSSAEAKAHFGDKYAYGEIKMVLEHLKGRQE